MAHSILNPADLHDPVPFGYSHTARVRPGCDLVFVAGQYASSPDGRVAAPAFADQVERALDNLALALAAHDLTLADVVRARMYVVGLEPAKLGTIATAVAARWAGRPPANTLVGVASLATPDMLFEIDALAARS